MHTHAKAPLRALSAAGLFAALLVAFVILTIIAFAITLVPLFGDQFSVFLFDLLGHTFPIACPDTVPYTSCHKFAHGWNASWSIVVWAAAAICYGISVRNLPLRYKVVVAILAIPTVILLMQWAMSLFGWTEYLDTL